MKQIYFLKWLAIKLGQLIVRFVKFLFTSMRFNLFKEIKIAWVNWGILMKNSIAYSLIGWILWLSASIISYVLTEYIVLGGSNSQYGVFYVLSFWVLLLFVRVITLMYEKFLEEQQNLINVLAERPKVQEEPPWKTMSRGDGSDC